MTPKYAVGHHVNSIVAGNNTFVVVNIDTSTKANRYTLSSIKPNIPNCFTMTESMLRPCVNTDQLNTMINRMVQL